MSHTEHYSTPFKLYIFEKLLWEFTARIRRGYLPWVFCICKQILCCICEKILFIRKQIFFIWGFMSPPPSTTFSPSKKKKGKPRKKRTIFKAETIEMLSPRSKCYCFSPTSSPEQFLKNSPGTA